jgi:hypothetical protein
MTSWYNIKCVRPGETWILTGARQLRTEFQTDTTRTQIICIHKMYLLTSYTEFLRTVIVNAGLCLSIIPRYRAAGWP